MNSILFTMIGFLCGLSFYAIGGYSLSANKAAIVIAYEIGKAECPPENVCAKAAKLTDVEPISFNDVTYGEF